MKYDLKKECRDLFHAKRNQFTLIDVPKVNYLMADGCGNPNTEPAYQEAVESLYSTAYAIKFACKGNGQDFVVAPLEGLWWADDPESFAAKRKNEWKWTMMIMMPDYVHEENFKMGKATAEQKRGHLTNSLRFSQLEEGLCFQALHIGPYDDEGPLLAELHETIMPQQGYEFAGPHHEIYLNDPRRTAPEKLKTILRQPVRKILANK